MKRFLSFAVALAVLIGGAGFSLASESNTNNNKSGDVVPYWNMSYSILIPNGESATTNTATKSRPDNRVYWHHKYSGGKTVEIKVHNRTKGTSTKYEAYKPGTSSYFTIAAHSGSDSMMGRLKASLVVDVLAQGDWNP
jgi:hypothetical protein